MDRSCDEVYNQVEFITMSDRHILYAAALLRALATGMAGVLIGLYLARLGFDAAAIGMVISAGLAGATAAVLLATFTADRIGRRRMLLGLTVLGAAGGAAAALGPGDWVMGVVAFLGMLNGMGRDRGAALVLEQAILPSTTDDAGRTGAFAWYNVLIDIGHAVGALLAALPSLLSQRLDIDETLAYQWSFVLYAALQAGALPLYLRLSPAAEAPREDLRAEAARVSPASRRILWRICALFGLDALAGGFMGAALMSYFFAERFGASAAAIGALFFGARIMNALSHLAAARLAKRIGLVKTMVFTHTPSSLLLVTVAFAPNFPVAAILFLLREGLVEMDVPTRQSYVMAVVRPEERSFASGVTHLVRLGGWAVAPAAAGLLMQGVALATPLVIGAGMKIGYDLMLYLSFRRIRPPEERTMAGVPQPGARQR
jgi:MFS family permease